MSDVDTGGPVVAPEDDALAREDPNAGNTEPLSGGDVASLREQAASVGEEGGGGPGIFPWTDPDRPENAEAMGGAGYRDVQLPASAAFPAPDGTPITSNQPLAVDTSGPAPVLVPATTQADVAAGRESVDPGGSVVVNEADLHASGRGIPEGATVAPRGTLDTGEADWSAPSDEGVDVEEVDQYHKGGGWYELPDGQRVQGKEAARETLAGG